MTGGDGIESVSSWSAEDPEDTDEQDAEFWSEFGWAVVRDDESRNMDCVPANIETEFRCPKCGSAWAELGALGFYAPRATIGRIVRLDPPFIVLEPYPITRVRALRIVCVDGHVVEYDSPTGKKRVLQIPSWNVVVGLSAVAIVGAAALLTGLRAGRRRDNQR